MDNRLILGIDLGGSSSKATMLDGQGKVIATSSREYPAYSPQPGWLEQDADELYDAVIINIKNCIAKAGIDSGRIEAVCLDAATHMAVLCDENDRPVRKFIHWSDSRCSKQVKYLKENAADLISRYSVNSVSTAWTLPQLMWLKENEPDTLRSAKKLYYLKDYIRSRITGDFCTDTLEVMGGLLSDDQSGNWVPELCRMAGIEHVALPEVKGALDIAGYISTEAANLTGLAAGTPVIVGTTDTALEVFATGAVNKGDATVKLATAGRICVMTDAPVPNHQFFNYRHVIPGLWYPGTGTRSCAASYKWYRNVFGEFEALDGKNAYQELDRAAEAVPPGSEDLYFHPYLLGEMTPYYDDKLRASFTGVGMHHTKGHFNRAVMEGISYSMRDCLEEVKAQNIPVNEYRVIGGGAKGKVWRQILADVLAMPLTITKDNDSSLGAAMLAGVAVGIFADFKDSVDKCVKVTDVVSPIPENCEVYAKGFENYRMIQRAMAEVYHKIV